MPFNLVTNLIGRDKSLGRALRGAGVGFRRLQRRARETGSAIGRSFKAQNIGTGDIVAAAGATTVLTAGIFKSTLAAGAFERQMKSLKVITGADDKAMAGLRKTTLALAQEFGVMPTQVGKAEIALARVGFKGDDIARSLRTSMQLVAASFGELGPEEAGGLLTTTLKSFGLQARQSNRIGNQLAKATTETALNFKKLGLQIGTASGFAAQFGSDTQTMLALLGATTDVIPRAERAATGVRNIYRDLSKTSTLLNAKQAGLNLTVSDGAGNFRNVIDIMGDLEDQLKDLDPDVRLAKLQKVFSIEAATAFGALMSRAKTGFKQLDGGTVKTIRGLKGLADVIGNANTTLEELVVAGLSNALGGFEKLKASVAVFAITIGEAFSTFVVPAMEMAAFTLKAFVRGVKEFGPIGTGFVAVLGFAAVVLGIIGPLVLGAVIAFKTWGVVTTILGFIQNAFWLSLQAHMIRTMKIAVVMFSIVAILLFAIGALFEAFGATEQLTGGVGKDEFGSASGEVATRAKSSVAKSFGSDLVAGLDTAPSNTDENGDPISAKENASRQFAGFRGTPEELTVNRIIQFTADGGVLSEITDKGRARRDQRNFKDE
jgi:TP901 family phage tail tape measure protein